ncbi:MAG: hypothetical protein F4X26_08980 [Chloroflexi bacterium]|nr:hypothetical protein [Chloroflexota bacterium]
MAAADRLRGGRVVPGRVPHHARTRRRRGRRRGGARRRAGRGDGAVAVGGARPRAASARRGALPALRLGAPR